MSRTLAFAPLLVLIGLALLFAGYALRHDPRVEPQALVGHPAPDVILPDLATGRPAPIRPADAGPVLLQCSASWCAPCAVETPTLLALEARGVSVIGVAYKDAPDKTRGFLARYGDPFAALLVDRDGRAGVEFGVAKVPETFLVGADGVVIAKHSGPLSEADASRLLARMR